MWRKILIGIGISLYLLVGVWWGIVSFALSSGSSKGIWDMIKIVLFWPFMLF